MSSSSEGRPFAAVAVVAVVAAAVAADDAALLLSLPSLTATLLHGVAEPEDRPLVLFPVMGKTSIGGRARTAFEGVGCEFFPLMSLGASRERNYAKREKAPPFAAPAAGSRAGRGAPHVPRERHARREGSSPARAGSECERIACPARGRFFFL